MYTTKKNNIVTFILIVILLIIVVQNCSNSVEPVSPKEKNIDTLYSKTHFLWPSKVGSYWDYKGYSFMNHYSIESNWVYKGFASFGLDLDTIKNVPFLTRIEIVDSIFINFNDTLYSCHIFSGYNRVTKKYSDLKFPYWIGDSGIYSMGIYTEGQDTLFNKGLLIPAEIPLNENWGGQVAYRMDGYFLQTNSVVERKCLSKNEVINTPIGLFECYVIFTRVWMADDLAGYFDYYDYYAPGVGKVCRVRLAVTPILGPNSYGEWWFDYILLLEGYSIN